MKKFQSVEEFIKCARITNVNVCQGLLDGKINVDDDVVKNSITQPSIYQSIYCDAAENILTTNVEEVTQDVHDDNDVSNDITFTIDDKMYTYKGQPDNTIASAFKSLKIKGTIYNGDDAVDTSLAISSLNGVSTLSKTKTVIDEAAVEDPKEDVKEETK